MGNITSVIRATSEVSNAVPVINGPINIRRLEDVTDKKTLYTEPIPLADTVVLNRRIEEKLYADRKASSLTFTSRVIGNRIESFRS